MAKFKLKLSVFALLFSMLALFSAFSFIAPSSVANAETMAEFNLVEGASLRYPKEFDEIVGGEEMRYKGIRFTTRVNGVWFEKNQSEVYEFGTLVFPADRGSVDVSLSVKANKNGLDAIRFIADTQAVRENGGYDASIVYDWQTVKQLAISAKMVSADDPLIDEKIQALLNKLYVMDLTAVSYVLTDSGVTYTSSYTTNMLKVALRLIKDPSWKEVASEYLGTVSDVKAYVSKEDNLLVLNGVSYNALDVTQVICGNEFLSYTVNGDDIEFSDEFVNANLGEYLDVCILDKNNNVYYANVLFADKALKTARDVEQAFDYGDQKVGDNFGRKDGVYVLANDIDMTGVTINNRMIGAGQSFNSYVSDGAGGYVLDSVTTTASDVGFGGVFDGLGHSISNVTVEMVNLSLGQPIVSDDGTKAYKNAQGSGFFANVLQGAQIRNVAFVNVYGKGSVSSGLGLNGLIGTTCYGTLENVYFDMSVNNVHARGPFAQYGAATHLKNVVVNYPKENYTIESHLESAKKSDGSYYGTYAYGYGALSGHNSPMSRSAKYENVIVASPMPVNLYKGAGGYDGISSVTYAENETELRVLFSYSEGTTIADAILAEKSIAEQYKKTYQIAGIRRYDDLAGAGSDATAMQPLLETGLFKIVNGQLVWHNLRAEITVSDAVDYDADSGKLNTTVFNVDDVLQVFVDGVELARDVDYKIVDGELQFLTIPVRTHKTTNDQSMAFIIATSDAVYTFDNVIYWTMLISDGAELKSALDIDYSTVGTNYGFYKLVNDVDMTGISYNYTAMTTKVVNQNYEFGFAGVFDGDGHAIKNPYKLTYGLFGNFCTGGSNYPYNNSDIVVKNVAITNVTSISGSPNNATNITKGVVLGRYSNTNLAKLRIENIYVTFADDSPVNGLIGIATGTSLRMNNVFVDTVGNTVAPGYKMAGAEYGATVQGKAVDFNNSLYTDGGTLFVNNRFITPSNSGVDKINNFISLGKTPIVYQWGNGANYNNYWTYDATNGWTIKNNSIAFSNEFYVGLASNRVGDVPIMTGMKAGFAEMVAGSNATSVAGYVCTGCGETFSKTAGACGNATCNGKALTYFSNLWTTPWSFTWTVTDTKTHVNAKDAFAGIVTVFAGVSKYDGVEEMKSAYQSDNTIFDSFLGDSGNGLWAVSDGQLVWKNFISEKSTVKVNGSDLTLSVELECGDNIFIEAFNGENKIELKSVTASNDNVEVLNDVVIGRKIGSSEITVKYVISEVEFTKKFTVYVNHAYGELIGAILSTCTEPGAISHYKCSCCDKYFDVDFNEIEDISVLPSHDYGEWISAGNGTHYKVCSRDNSHVIIENCLGDITCTQGAHCSVCGADNAPLGHIGGEDTCEVGAICERCNVEYGAPLGHSYTVKNVSDEYLFAPVTCENKAVYYYACANCEGKHEDYKYEHGEALGHNYSVEIISDEYLFAPATCTTKAVYYYACANCEGKHEDYKFEHGDVLGHTGGEDTCEVGAICSRCNVEYGTALGHTGGKANCSHYAVCSRCNEHYGDYGDHEYAYGYNELNHWIRCSVCQDESLFGTHSYGEQELIKTPTCEEEGEIASACVCGYHTIIYVDKLSHEFGEFISGTDATCVASGTIGHYVCGTCGKNFDENGVLLESTVAPIKHNFKTFNQQIAPTCSETGSKGFYHCEDCGKYFDFDLNEISYDSILIPATGHLENSSGRCECGEVYFDVIGEVTIDPLNSYRATSEYFEFIYAGHIYPGQNSHKWAWRVNRFFGEKDDAPVHVRIPSVVYTVDGRELDVISIGNYLFDVTGDISGYYYSEYDEEGNATTTNTSPKNGNGLAKAIQSVVITNGIEFIGSSAFGSTEITELIIPNSVLGGYGKVEGTANGTLPTPAGGLYNHENYAWPLDDICGGCNLLKKVVIGSGVDIIGGYCFYGLPNLVDIEFVVTENADGTKEGVKEIRPRAFGQNTSATIDPTSNSQVAGRIVLPETLVSVPEGSILHEQTGNNVRLYRLFNPDPIYFLNITEQEYNARQIPAIKRDAMGFLIKGENGEILDANGNEMQVRHTTTTNAETGVVSRNKNYYTTYGYTEGCFGQAKIYFKGEWEYVDGVPMANEELFVPEISYDVTDGTFKALSNGTLVGLTEQGKALTEITVPSQVNGVAITKIGSNALKGANALTTLTLPSTVTEIEEFGLADLKSLKNLTVTSSLASVGRLALRNSVNVTKLIVKSQTASVSDIIVMGTSEIAKILNGLGDFSLSVSGDKYVVTTSDEVYFLDNQKFVYTADNKLVAYLGVASEITVYDFIVEIGDRVFENRNITKITIPNSVLRIGANAFRNTLLTEIKLPENLEYLGEGAFSGSAISSVVIPKTLTAIPRLAFKDCFNLTSVELGDNIVEIGYGAFMNAVKLDSIELPSGARNIGDFAFYGASALRKVKLPKTIENIGHYAFANLPSIYKIDYDGSKNEWRLISIKNDWKKDSNEFEIRCVDGLGGYLNVEQSVQLAIGESHAIWHYIPNAVGEIKWISNNESVAVVDANGKLLAKDVGVTEVVVSYGDLIGICYVSVSYGDYLPTVEFKNELSDGVSFDVGSTYSFKPYVSFNRLAFNDAKFSYEVSDGGVVSVDENGKLTAIKTGACQITVKATWRSYKASEYLTLEKTFDVNVVGKVEFRLNGNLPLYTSVYAPVSHSQNQNQTAFNPMVIVDGVAFVPEVLVNYLDGATTDHIKVDVANKKLIGYKLGKAEIILSYNAFGLTFKSKFIFEVLPNEVALEDEIKFSAEDGFAFINGEQMTLGEYLGDQIVRAESQGEQLFIDGNGAVLGVNWADYALRSTTIVAYSELAKYTIPVSVAKWYINEESDFVSALDLGSQDSRELTVYGYHELINNVDLAGVTLYNNSVSTGTYVFAGTFNGNGFAIKNANLNMQRSSNKYITQGLFGTIDYTATVKNVAFINLEGTASNGADVGLNSPLAYLVYGKIENVYVQIGKNNYNNRGAIANYRSSAVIKNFVVYEEREEDYEFSYEQVIVGATCQYAWGYGSLGGAIGEFKSASVENVFVISKNPLHLSTSGGGASCLENQTGTFTYGENETKVWFEFAVWSQGNNPILNPTVQNTLGNKTAVIENVRRYDSFGDMALDTSDRNVEKTQALLDTGLWIKNASGEIVWNSVQ